MGTIIQSYGPIYGEVVNGTVQGRPNGSIYVPNTNTIKLDAPSELIKNRLVNGAYRVVFCDNSGNNQSYVVSALSQDLASNMRVILCTDSTLETIVADISQSAGLFNQTLANVTKDYQLDPDDTYYIAAQLLNNGTPVAVSDVVTVTVWVAE